MRAKLNASFIIYRMLLLFSGFCYLKFRQSKIYIYTKRNTVFIIYQMFVIIVCFLNIVSYKPSREVIYLLFLECYYYYYFLNTIFRQNKIEYKAH